MDTVLRAAAWTGWPLDRHQLQLLERYGSWLMGEAIPSGGLGPNEAGRIEQRHLADSVLLAGAWPPPDPPHAVVDLGSGVGLPGVPLAILWPRTRVVLVDRSGRRADLARRAVRILDLESVEVIQADAARVELSEVDLVVARAAAAPDEVFGWARRLLSPGGVAAVGGSWLEAPPVRPGERLVEVPPEVLDRPVWIRIMAAA